jgi:hypothetical protein
MRRVRSAFISHIAGAVATCALVLSTAQAASIGFSTQSTFNAAAAANSIPLTTDNLNDVADSALSSSLSRLGYTISGPPNSLGFQNNSAFCSGGANPSTGCITGTFGQISGVPQPFIFQLNASANAFGFELSVANDLSGEPAITSLGIRILDGADAGATLGITGTYCPNGSLF